MGGVKFGRQYRLHRIGAEFIQARLDGFVNKIVRSTSLLLSHD